MLKDKANGSGQVLAGSIRSPCAVDQGESVISPAAQFQSVGKAFMDCPYIVEAPSCTDQGKGRIGLSTEEKQSGIPFIRVPLFLRLCINIVKNPASRLRFLLHVPYYIQGGVCIYIIMVDQHRACLGKGHRR